MEMKEDLVYPRLLKVGYLETNLKTSLDLLPNDTQPIKRMPTIRNRNSSSILKYLVKVKDPVAVFGAK